jgi:hypothetical protein
MQMKIVLKILVVLILSTTPAFAQFSTQNPLDELKNQVEMVLRDAEVPFTAEQEQQLALLMEEQRQASEDLFGEIMDFSKGPPQGADRDRALAGIQWMHDEFKKQLANFLTADQRAAWEKFESAGTAIGARVEAEGAGRARTEQIQQIRVTNNAFNAENGSAGQGGPNGGGRTEVIQRGGAGAFHGNFEARFQDETLNARNPFASNKPSYYERTINGNFSGPIVKDRLTATFSVNDNRAENVGTVKALTLDGPFALGITRPDVNREYEGSGILQLTDAHSLHFGVDWETSTNENQNIGNFTLPERGSKSTGREYGFNVRQVSVLSERNVYETTFEFRRDHSETNPYTNAVAINVLDAFNGGGGQNRSEVTAGTYNLSNLFYHSSEKLTLRTGFSSSYRRERSLSETNFIGEFTFSDLESYRAGKPLKYKVTVGNPLLEMSQLQLGIFSQQDMRLTNRFTLMLGLRYQNQTNISDHNNVDPRVGFAYALGNTTVLRGGSGIFHSYLASGEIQSILRLDGTRQYEIQVDNPGWPDPFLSGNVRTIPPSSRRVKAPELAAQYYIGSQISLEHSFPSNLFVSVSFDHNRGVHLPRLRNLNAPLPGTGEKPFPTEGQIIQFQSSGIGSHKNFRVSMRQRFSIFNITGKYSYYAGYNDNGIGGNTSGGSPGLPADSYNLRLDRGHPGANPKHTFDSSINSRLPLNVYLTTTISAKSGSMYNVTTGRDDNQDGITNDRPVGVPKFNAVGPGYFNVSFNFSKAFQLRRSAGNGGGSGPQVNVFADLNNAFNMTHFGTPSGVMTSPFFGKPTNATSPREIEAGMRFQF